MKSTTSKNFNVEIEKDTIEKDGRFVTVVIKDEKNNILARQKLQSFTAGKLIDNNFSDHYEVYN